MMIPPHHTPFDAMEISMLCRMVVATILGAAIGFEREIAGKVAGLRTHALVALGSALFAGISLLLFTQFPSVNGATGYDYHLIANIIVGIGFIGAGAILRNGDHVSGTTTAASLWVAAGIGMAAGLGFYVEALFATALAYGVLAVLWQLEKHIRKSPHYRQEHPENKGAEREAAS